MNPYEALGYIVLAGLCLLGWLLIMVVLFSLGKISQSADAHISEEKL
jgi:hypothetical protein